MKNIMIFSLTTFILNSCVREGPVKTYIYTVKNASDYTIKVQSYFRNQNFSPITTIFSKGESKTKIYKDTPSYSGYDFGMFFNDDSSYGGDSIIITFNNEKRNWFIKKVSCDDYAERNPLNDCIYQNLVETFVFTNEDYNNAEDCGGPCE